MWASFRDKILCPLNGGVPWLEVSQRRISTDHCRRRLRETVRSYWNRPGESDRGIHFSCRHCPSWRTFFTSREAFMHCLFWFQGTSCDLSGGERYVVSWWELNVVVKFLVVSAHFCPKNKRRWNTWGFFSLIRPLATGFSWKTANLITWPRFLRPLLQFAVHVWTAGRASSGKWLTARFLLRLKIIQTHF